MSAPGHPAPADLDRVGQRGLVVGGAAAAALAAGFFIDAPQFYRSYLFGFLFWAGVGIGCLSLVMINHLTGGMWGLVIRKALEAGARTLYFAPLFFLPIALGVAHIFPWAGPEAHDDPIIQKKALYLNVPFFIGRAALYFAVWAGLAYGLSRLSAELDEGADYRRTSRRLRGLAGGGLLLMGLTITFASVDWGMSLNPHWFSTIYGVLFMVGTGLAALTLAIVFVARYGREEPLSAVLAKETVHDLGKLLFAFVMLWAYVSVSQFLIVWSANLPEEIPWYIQRLRGGWQALALALVLLHFALPFLLLLPRDVKRNARLLAGVAGTIFAVRLLDLFWLVGPDLAGGHGGHGGAGLHVSWMDAVAPLALGGLWLAGFARQVRGGPILPIGEPEIRKRLEAARRAA